VEEVKGGSAVPFFRKVVVFASKIPVFCSYYTSVIIKSSPNCDVFGVPVIISLFEISFTIILCINTKLETNLGLIGLTKQRKNDDNVDIFTIRLRFVHVSIFTIDICLLFLLLFLSDWFLMRGNPSIS
jgi:hypothetical protein